MEAGAVAAGGRTGSERFADVMARWTDAPRIVKVAVGVLILNAVLLVVNGVGTADKWPDSAAQWLGIIAVVVVTIAALSAVEDRPSIVAMIVLANVVAVLLIFYGVHDVTQRGLNGLSLGAIYALGAVGLTLVYGILKLTNFAHGDFLTFGAYMAYIVNVTWGGPLILGILFAVLATAGLGIALEKGMFAPMRRKGAGVLQLLLMTLALGFVIRYTIQFIWSTELRQLDVNRSAVVDLPGDLIMGRIAFTIVIVGIVILVATGLMLRMTHLGKQMRALSDNLDLAETSGINTSRVILYTWIFAAGLAGLAGVLYGANTQLQPEMGFELLLPIFAAVVLGGIGNAFGALAAGLVLGVVIEWSTLFLVSGLKFVVGFAILIIVLVIRPEGIFGKARTV
jgi:neutral amino acid transport system permease protein